MIVVGMDGKPKTQRFTPQIPCSFGKLVFTHQFLIIPECLAPLLGRDIMCKLGMALTVHSTYSMLSKGSLPKNPAEVES
jgi:hypothetical protein